MSLRRSLLPLTFLFALSASLAACAPRTSGDAKAPTVEELRKNAAQDSKQTSAWFLAELLAPDGSPAKASQARKALDQAKAKDLLAELGRGIDDSAHGQLKSAPEAMLRAVKVARDSDDPRAELVGWYATRQAVGFRSNDPQLWKRWKPFVQETLKRPGRLGFRARAELADWALSEAYAEGEKDIAGLSVKLHGCVKDMRLAGPFGRNAAPDLLRSFPAEAPGPWPARFPTEPGQGEPPRQLQTTRTGCNVEAKEPMPGGVYYAETFVTLDQATEVLVWAGRALRIWVDDTLLVSHDVRDWGTWTNVAGGAALEKGRHRVLVEVTDPSVEIRLLERDGRPLVAPTDTEGSKPYSLARPAVLAVNTLAGYVSKDGVRDPKDHLLRFVIANLAGEDGGADVASVMIEPLVADPGRATGIALATAARFTDSDPIYDNSQRRDLVRQLNERAAKRDPNMWSPKLSLGLWEAEKSGMPEGARVLKALTRQFPEVPAILASLTRLYNELGWYAAYSASARELATRFADDADALEVAIPVLDVAGDSAMADKLTERVRVLNPDSEIMLGRALARHDYAEALKELKRIGARHPERKDIAERIYDVMVRSGNVQESWNKLEAAIKQNPKNTQARLALADAGLAAGKADALVQALVAAVEGGAETEAIEEALDLVEGATELEPYRHDAFEIIAAYEKSGIKLPGIAARVLDYSAVWVHSDGSSRMLEHEIIQVQSAEAITQQAEQELRRGLWLHLRVIKKNGQIFEPEIVDGKPTATLPHLEVGDYVETERIESNQGDGERGMRYFGPRWFFREENIAYARSEFLVVSPKDRPLQIESKNNVPPPEVNETGSLIVRRWRVDQSPAAPVEPFGAPISEFLPSVQIGWGADLASALRAMSDGLMDLTPKDPRIVRIAQRIVAPATKPAERAQKLYRWVVGNVQEGEEDDGRRAIVGKNGNLWRAYITLCRALDIQVDYAAAQNRLALPPSGPFSEQALFTQPLIRVGGDKGTWLTLGSKYAAFGYVPAEARGMPAYLLSRGKPELTKTPSEGTIDDMAYEGSVKLLATGAADVTLTLSFTGKYATGLRNALSQMPEDQLRDVLESRLLGRELRGIQLSQYKVEHFDDLDSPLLIHVQGHVQGFAQKSAGGLVVSPPFGVRLSQLAVLPSRQTPLLLVDATHQRIKLKLELPAGAKLEQLAKPLAVKDGERQVTVRDALQGNTLVLDREIQLPAGRVQPAAYGQFQEFARQADDALFHSVRVRLP
jgi:tetratricopeptide (TPR) repeat protein